jgi:hypothetical protein
VLTEEYGYTIQSDFRTRRVGDCGLFMFQKQNFITFIGYDEQQKAFILAKEIV